MGKKCYQKWGKGIDNNTLLEYLFTSLIVQIKPVPIPKGDYLIAEVYIPHSSDKTHTRHTRSVQVL